MAHSDIITELTGKEQITHLMSTHGVRHPKAPFARYDRRIGLFILGYVMLS